MKLRLRCIRLRTAALLAVGLCLAFAGLAQAITHQAHLDGSQEVPPTPSPAHGFAKMDLNAQAMTLRIVLAFGQLMAPETAAHIHGPASAGVNAPVLLPLPLGIFDQTFPINAATLAAIQAGLAYVNVHSTLFPAGEIRGQITSQAIAVEETTFGQIKALYR